MADISPSTSPPAASAAGAQDPHVKWSEARLPLRSALVLQGGGARGLVLLGQVLALINDKNYRPIAYAGSSAGALIALLLWAGLSPDQALSELKSRSRWRGLMAAMFSFVDKLVLALQYLLLWFVMNWNLYVVAPVNVVLRALAMRGFGVVITRVGSRGDKFEDLIEKFLRLGLEKRGIDANVIAHVLGKDAAARKLTFADVEAIKNSIRDINDITSEHDAGFKRILSANARLQQAHQSRDIHFFPKGDRGSRNNILFQLFGREIETPYFPPLFVTATSVTTEREVFFNNLEKRFQEIAIAAAVRASAGHPLAFGHKKLMLDGREQEFSDGGIVLNYPTMAIDRLLRELTQETIADAKPGSLFLDEKLKHSSFATLGLTLSESSSPKSVTSLVLGQAKSRLEDILAKSSRRLIHSQQPVPADYPQTTDFHLLTKSKIQEMAQTGRGFIAERMPDRIDSFSIDDDTRAGIVAILKETLVHLKRTLAYAEPDYARIQVYVGSTQNYNHLQKLCFVCLDKQVSTFTDSDLPVKRDGGLINLTRTNRAPVISRLDLLRQQRYARPTQPVLGLTYQDVAAIDANLNFGISVPIYDPRTTRYLFAARPFKRTEENGVDISPLVHVSDTKLDGTLFGVLALDFCMNRALRSSLAEHVETPRVQAIIRHTERFAYEIGCHLARAMERHIASLNHVLERPLSPEAVAPRPPPAGEEGSASAAP